MTSDEPLRVSLHVPGGSKVRKFYVYLHKDPEGKVFYVGKGENRRAWEKNSRHSLWYSYVDRFNGNYVVEIVKEGLEEDDAMWLEEDLMKRYGGQLVNWVNLARDANYTAYGKYWDMRKEIDLLLAKANELEKLDLEKAIELYRQAMGKMKENECMEKEEYFTGLAAELYKDMQDESRVGNITILDRLTICLKKLKRSKEIVSEVEQYLKDFPRAKDRAGFNKILRRANLYFD